MPVHTYHCEECDHEFDIHQAFDEDAITVCPECGKKGLFKIYKPALVMFKGSGFYVTDSKSASATLTSGVNNKVGSNGKDAGDNSSDSAKPPAKTETKTTEASKNAK